MSSWRRLITPAFLRALRGELDKAQKLLLRARRVAELENARPALLAPPSPTSAPCGCSRDAPPKRSRCLGDCYRARARVRDAETLYEGARRIADRAYGPRHAAILPSLSGLAVVARQRGDDARAETLHREALALGEKALPPGDPGRAELLGNLASFYARQGEGGAAEHLYLRALAVLERLEKEDPRRAAVLHGLASLYATQGRRAEAERIERALAPPRAMLSMTTPIPPAAEP